RLARLMARFTETVVFPTPPLPEPTATRYLTPGIGVLGGSFWGWGCMNSDVSSYTKSTYMKMRIAMAFFTCILAQAQQAPRQEPQFTADGRLMPPADYRDWVFLSSGLGMTYGLLAQGATAEHPRFENVFVNPRAYKAFLQTGTWPDKTMLILEVRS